MERVRKGEEGDGDKGGEVGMGVGWRWVEIRRGGGDRKGIERRWQWGGLRSS